MTTAHNKIKGILANSDVTVDQLTRMNEVLQERIDELEYVLLTIRRCVQYNKLIQELLSISFCQVKVNCS